jgi:putative radical SAM enzyme (TIGR03279 family)
VPPGLICRVAPASLADRLGLRSGDELFAINGHGPRDVIDVQFYAAEERLAFDIRRQGQDLTVCGQRRYDEPLGLEFVRPTFDSDVRRCDNGCEFCFVAQMPKGLRRSLYVKDDDYRHSFLFGTYITLTNLTDEDWARIGEQHLSPLYVSVHATDPVLRRRLVRNAHAPGVMAQLGRLAALGIEVHTQIVLVPGVNDGPHLDRSIGELVELYPAIRSVSVVPVGLTKYHRGGCRLHTLEEARTIVAQVSQWQTRLLPRLKARFAYLADEWYLRLGQEVPAAQAYDGLDLTENGVGLVRRFLDSEFDIARRTLEPAGCSPDSATLVTGTLFAPVLRQATADLPGVEVVSVANHFLGETVTVAGLLTAQDVIEQLKGQSLGDCVVLPAAMFAGPEGQSLDEKWPHEVGRELGRPVLTAHHPPQG